MSDLTRVGFLKRRQMAPLRGQESVLPGAQADASLASYSVIVGETRQRVTQVSHDFMLALSVLN